jgi:hypothetical protein
LLIFQLWAERYLSGRAAGSQLVNQHHS